MFFTITIGIPGTKGIKMKEEKQPLLNGSSETVADYETKGVASQPPPGRDDGSGGEKGEALPPDYDPLQNRQLEHPTTNLDTMIHLLKGNIGTGILAMPDAFLNAGLFVGTIGILIMGMICTHCMHMLVNCAHELCRRGKVPFLGFSQVVEQAFKTGPRSLQPLSGLSRIVVNVFLTITQLGFCCVYFVFVATNLQQVFEQHTSHFDIKWYLLALLVPMILLNWVRNLKYLTPVSLFAAILTVSGLAVTFFYILQGLPRTNTVKMFATWRQLPLFFGTAIYAFEGIGIVLPLENNMETPEDFGGMTGVLNTGMVIVACLYTAVGFFGYLRYGDHMKRGSITLNIPQDEILGQSVRVTMAIAIFFSYCLQFYVPMNIIWPSLKKHIPEERQNIVELVIRTALVSFTFLIALAVQNLSIVISLVGAVSSSTLALIFPPLIEIITFWDHGLTRTTLIKDIGILIFGCLGFIFGTYASIHDIIDPPHS